MRRLRLQSRLIVSFVAIIAVPVLVALSTATVTARVTKTAAVGRYAQDIGAVTEQIALPLQKFATLAGRAADSQGYGYLLKRDVLPLLRKTKGVFRVLDASGTVRMEATSDGTVRADPATYPLFPGEDPRPPSPAPREPVTSPSADQPANEKVMPVGPGGTLEIARSGQATYTWGVPGRPGWQGRFIFAVEGLPNADIADPGRFPTVVAVGSGALTFVVLVVLLTLWILRSIRQPLKELLAATRNVGEGNLDFSITYRSDDELGKLCDAFELMRGKLRASLLKLHENDEDRRRMIASIVHDLRTPVTSVRGYVEGLADNMAESPERRGRYLEVIRRKTDRLSRLIEDLFALTRLELGDVSLRWEKVTARDLLAATLDAVREEAEDGKSMVRISGPVPDVLLTVDRRRFLQLLDNLVQNSVRYAGAQCRIEIAAERADGFVRFTVRDDGPGFPEAHLPRVFEVFFRGESARTEGGSGLGLSICRRIVELHGGTIRAENDHGAVVRFTLPVVPGG